MIRSTRRREGFALAVALIALVVIGALIAGAFFASTQEYRIGRNTLVGQRAFSIAEYGLNYEVSHWNRARNLPAPSGMAVGAIDSSHIFVANGDTSYVKVTRLNDNTFWVVSEGNANMGNAMTQARRRTSSLVRIAYPTVKVGGAVVVAGDLTLKGGAKIHGENSAPSGWTQCDSIGGSDTAAVEASKTAHIDADTVGASDLTGALKLVRDSAASDSNTYIRYGSETWNSLAANADIKISTDPNPLPVGTDSTCDTSGANQLSNWGEPFRSGNWVKGCKNYFPIIYADQSLTLNGNNRGQGILLVNGDLKINGTFDFFGLIIVRDDIDKGTGNATVHGSVMARNANIGDGGSEYAGTQDVYYSKCAIESALRASAILTRAKERGWAQLF